MMTMDSKNYTKTVHTMDSIRFGAWCQKTLPGFGRCKPTPPVDGSMESHTTSSIHVFSVHHLVFKRLEICWCQDTPEG